MPARGDARACSFPRFHLIQAPRLASFLLSEQKNGLRGSLFECVEAVFGHPLIPFPRWRMPGQPNPPQFYRETRLCEIKEALPDRNPRRVETPKCVARGARFSRPLARRRSLTVRRVHLRAACVAHADGAGLGV